MKTIRYDDYHKKANTFDVLNFESKTKWYDPRTWFWHAIGHTAMAYKSHNGQLHCWESTSRGLLNQSGVQMNSLKLRLQTCNSRVFVRQVEINSRTTEMQARVILEHFIERERGKPYPDLKTIYGQWYLIKAALDCGKLTQNKENPKIRFCTDLIAATYRDCGLAKFVCASSEFEPDDMRCKEYDSLILPEFDRYLVDGITLSDEVEIVL